MSWHVVALDSVMPTPWRNGGGTTRELLAWPRIDWRMRASVAEVAQDGPFSRFEGLDRWFVVLEGAGVHLREGCIVDAVKPGDAPFRFKGDAEVHCTLIDGPTRDFNFMAPQGAGRLCRVQGEFRASLQAPSVVAAYAMRGALLRYGPSEIDLPADTLAWCVPHGGESVVLEGDALWMECSL